MWDTYTVEYYPVLKIILTYVKAWVRLEDIMLLETNHYKIANTVGRHAHEMRPEIIQFIEGASRCGVPGTVGGQEW